MMRPRHGQQGVSLIEAIVALGVMAFGMLAVVGVQATLRSGGDLARQRTEAMRIAQETMEGYRAYAALEGTAGVVDFNEIITATRAAVDVTGTALDGRLNTTFYRTITAPALSNSSRMKPVAVTVDWADRGGQFQSVELRSLISGVPPELAGSLALPPAHEPSAAPQGRHRSVPLRAMTLPGGISVFKPPQRPSGTVAWVLNNFTGLVTGVCIVDAASTTETITATDVASCSNNTTGQLLSGYVRFAAGSPDVAEAESPNGPTLNLSMALALSSTHPSSPQCYDDATRDASDAAARREVSYYCLVYSNVAGTWAGRSRIAPRAFEHQSAWTIGTGSMDYKVCRYTPLASDTGTKNADHPLDYTTSGSVAGTLLANQNFLVIGALFACPSETVTAGDPFNSSTRLHQDGSATYDNP